MDSFGDYGWTIIAIHNHIIRERESMFLEETWKTPSYSFIVHAIRFIEIRIRSHHDSEW